MVGAQMIIKNQTFKWNGVGNKLKLSKKSHEIEKIIKETSTAPTLVSFVGFRVSKPNRFLQNPRISCVVMSTAVQMKHESWRKSQSLA